MIYLDHAATTRPDPAVLEAMLPYLSEAYYNPSALYQPAVRVRSAIDRARDCLAGLLHTTPDRLYFTSGGTESDNWALRAAAESRKDRGRHILSSPIEHPAVRNCLKALSAQGFEVTELPVDETGLLDPETVRRAIREDTILLTVLFASHELGTIQPVAELGALARERGILFHTDAVQALGRLPIDLEALPVDLLSASAHKLYGPKGVGLLYRGPRAAIGGLLQGGGQERGRRPGTENVAGIVGFGKAAELAAGRMAADAERERRLRDAFWEKLRADLPGLRRNGHPERCMPNHLSLRFPHTEAESLIMQLDQREICVSAGAACSAGAALPAPGLLACGLSEAEARRSLRLTLGRETTEAELDTVRQAILACVQAGGAA